MTTTTTYNGWANYETWNVALWIGNDEGLYNYARESRLGWANLAMELDEMRDDTPDGVAWLHPQLDIEALDSMLDELREA